jgi:Coenzyme PQQ synthesis protein D (PqqD)
MNSSPMLDKDLRPKKRPGLNERTSEGEVLILDRINGRIHHLNPTASYVWKQCDGSSAKAIAEKLVQAFQIDLATAERDVNKVLGEMKRMNLLEICD